MESNLGPLGGAPVQHGRFLMLAGGVHKQGPATVGGAGAQRAQEVTKLPIGMALIALGEDLSGADIKGGKEIDGAMADRLTLWACDQARPQGQRRVPALQGLEVGLLSQAQTPTGAGGRQKRARISAIVSSNKGSGRVKKERRRGGLSTTAAKIRWPVAGLMGRISPRPATTCAKSRTL